MLGRQLTHLLAVLLWIGAGLALLAGMPQIAVAIVVIVLLNAVFAFWQEYRADRSAEELRTLLPSATRVVRNGRTAQVSALDLVVDDVVLLAAGDRVGADLELVTARSLALDESLLTGESGGVPREAGDLLRAGTFVLTGEGRAVVVAVGAHTSLADIASLTATAGRPASPLTVQLNRVVKVIAVLAATTGATLGATSLLLGLGGTEAFIFGVGVTVALVPEGLLPTVTLSLARGARLMAHHHALVRRLDAVETLGATTFICTDKTGTLTQNRMSVVEVLTPAGSVAVHGHGYLPVATFSGDAAAREAATAAATSALACVTGRAVHRADAWAAEGDPMEAALHCLALRLGVPDTGREPVRRPYTAERLLSSALDDGTASVLGAPEAVLARCGSVPADVHDRLEEMTRSGRRVLAVARRSWEEPAAPAMEEDLQFLGVLALQDPPRPDVAEALASCHRAGIRVAMLTGDHPGTARAIAQEVGLLDPEGVVLVGRDLPEDDAALAAHLDTPHGAVVARVSPADKLRIARVLRERGHVVAMTGDGVNDAPALREADVGVAMGASGSDVARESADLVLLDDHFATIVRAVELGRSTFQNIRRFLTYHLTDNVAELAPFAVWAATGGDFPLAIAVLQVLALDIGTDLLPALALGGEPPREGIMEGRRRRTVIDRFVLVRALLVLGATEAVVSLGAFTAVLLAGGWRWGETPPGPLLFVASGTAFTAIAAGQMANAFACRSTTRPVWRLRPLENPWVLAAVVAEAALVVVFVGFPPLADLLGGGWPSPLGWVGVGATAAAVVVVDGLVKTARGRAPGGRG
jgi:magnesium-transporting ATPase (P-type)